MIDEEKFSRVISETALTSIFERFLAETISGRHPNMIYPAIILQTAETRKSFDERYPHWREQISVDDASFAEVIAYVFKMVVLCVDG